MDKIRILLAEDESALGLIVKESLETRNFEVIHCLDGEKALEMYLIEKPQVLVLDIMMPKKDGFTLAKEIRKTDKNTPIIFLTSKSQTQDVVDGFELGGNDYLKKPFSMEELIVRINALLKRNIIEKIAGEIAIGNYIFDATKQTLTIDQKTMTLTHRESALLELLINSKNEILDRSLILKTIWSSDDFFSGRSMDVFISKLRKKLAEDSSVQILNIRGFGYKMIY
jgi:DNA-binding response OmpR family regulator